MLVNLFTAKHASSIRETALEVVSLSFQCSDLACSLREMICCVTKMACSEVVFTMDRFGMQFKRNDMWGDKNELDIGMFIE